MTERKTILVTGQCPTVKEGSGVGCEPSLTVGLLLRSVSTRIALPRASQTKFTKVYFKTTPRTTRSSFQTKTAGYSQAKFCTGLLKVGAEFAEAGCRDSLREFLSAWPSMLS